MPAPTGRALVTTQVALESFSMSADGRGLVYVLRRVVRGAYVSHLWSVGWEGGAPRQLTSGRVRDTAPAISPNGRWVAFVRERVGAKEDSPAQLWILSMSGGRPWKLTRQRHGAGTPRWSLDSRTLAFLGQAGEHRFLVGPERKKRSPIAYRMTRTDFRDDDSGQLSRRTHLWRIAARRGAIARQLTQGDFDVADPAWAPDGAWLAFSADMGPDTNISPRVTIHRVPASGGAHRPLAELAGDAWAPAISPDGRRVAFRGTDVPDVPDDTLTQLWVAPISGGTPRCLTADLDRSVENGGWADLVMADDVPGPIWLDDHHLVVLVGDRSRNIPYLVTDRGRLTPLTDEDRLVGAGLAEGSGHVAISAGLDGRAAELYALDGVETPPARLRRLTSQGSNWQSRFPRPRWEERFIDGPGGRIQVWVVSPPGAGREPLPAVVVLHGGPIGSSAPGGTMDSTMLAGHGYRVVLPNVRGSDTFGSAWLGTLGGRWGEADAEDVEAVVAALLDEGLLARGRIGVMGLSYGGFLTQWLAGSSESFAVAVAENGVANQASAWGTSFFGVHYNRRARLGDPLSDEGMQQLWRTSPLRNAQNIRIPLLMLQSAEDQICPPGDNQQLFTALKVLGREVEFVLYPEEHHEMKTYGRPDRRIDRMERILAWFDRYLKRAAT
jgi:dipeptidyl aminopeptidase/acylaminoacyl peptidase